MGIIFLQLVSLFRYFDSIFVHLLIQDSIGLYRIVVTYFFLNLCKRKAESYFLSFILGQNMIIHLRRAHDHDPVLDRERVHVVEQDVVGHGQERGLAAQRGVLVEDHLQQVRRQDGRPAAPAQAHAAAASAAGAGVGGEVGGGGREVELLVVLRRGNVLLIYRRLTFGSNFHLSYLKSLCLFTGGNVRSESMLTCP